ncbi:Biotin/lipoyl attachment domain-containing protein [Candidatus Sulfopaludibacter sp. SbA3]|nr:Biotin/lipoyl attachment domain-containing protein [Candidatus Sulfopaludibacter sp. SbA3]
MKLDLTIQGAPGRIEILAPGPACRFRLDEGPLRDADVEVPEPGVYSVLMDGHSYEARVEETPGGLVVVIDGFRFEMSVHDPRRFSRKSSGRGGEGVQTVAAPMPGKVVRVLVAPGDAVEAGQGIVVVEAMKMQNEMKASRAGRVLTVSVKEGATVSAGDTLATIG